MSAQLSNYITGCVRSGRHLLSAFTIEGPRVAASFLEETEPHLEEGDAEPRPDGLLVAIERKLRAALDYLVETDHAVAAAVGLESELRQRHRADKRQLAFLIVALRRMVLAQYVEPDMENLGLQPVNVRDGVTIARRAELIDQRFEAANLLKMLGQSRFEEPADLSGFVAEIRAKAAELLTLNGEIDEAHRAADRARIERDRAKEVYDRVYLRGARMFEDMCRFAGLDELADRIRRRKSRPAVAVETVAVVASESSTPESLASPEPGGAPKDDPSPNRPADSTDAMVSDDGCGRRMRTTDADAEWSACRPDFTRPSGKQRDFPSENLQSRA